MKVKILMRQEWPPLPAANRVELEYLLHLLQKLMPHDRAILFGGYAGGRMRSELGGYELLLVTCNTPQKEGWQLERLLNENYCHAIREQRHIRIETAGIGEINALGPRSWFYTHIRNEGTILYDNSQVAPLFTHSGFQHKKAWKEARQRYDYYFGTGSALLEAAARSWESQQPSVASIQLSYAALLLLRAEEGVFYDKQIRTSDMQVLFRRCRHFSRELLRTFPLDEAANVEFFRELTQLRRAPCRDCRYQLAPHKYKGIMQRIRLLQQLVELSCSRHLAFLERDGVECRRATTEVGASEVAAPRTGDALLSDTPAAACPYRSTDMV